MSGADEPLVIPLDAQGPAERRLSPPTPVVVALALIGIAIAIIATDAPEPSLEWTEGTAPQSRLNARSIVATPTGFSVLGGLRDSGGTVWSTADGVDWDSRTLPHLSRRIVYHHRGLFVIDRGSLTRIGPDGDDPIGIIDLPEPIRIGRGSGRAGLVAAFDGLLAQVVSGDVFWSPDGRDFDLVIEAGEWGADSDVTPRPSDVVDVAAGRVRTNCEARAQIAPDVPPVLVTPTRLLALIPEHDPSVIWPVCEPILWESPDGSDWAPRSDESPFPEAAYVYDAAWRDGRFIAVGGIGFDDSKVWTSRDGDTWTEIDSIPAQVDADVTRVAAGPAGWIVMAAPRDGSSPIAWYSAGGECWTEVPRESAGSGVAVGDDLIVFVEDDPVRVSVGTPTDPLWTEECG